MAPKLRHNHRGWLAYLRGVAQERETRRAADDGMSHGIIPFGAVTMWGVERERRQADILARPQPARVIQADETGVVLSVRCPYCRREHRHVVDPEGWEAARPVAALCGGGDYRVALAE